MSRTDTHDADDVASHYHVGRHDPISIELRTLASALPSRLPGPDRLWTVRYDPESGSDGLGSIRVRHAFFDDCMEGVIDSHHNNADELVIVARYLGSEPVAFRPRDDPHAAAGDLAKFFDTEFLAYQAPTGLTTLTRLFA